MKKLLSLVLLIFCCSQVFAQANHTIKNLKITILSKRTVLENCKELKIDLSKVHNIVLSHSHWDHTIGWIPLRKEISTLNKDALSITHAAKGIF